MKKRSDSMYKIYEEYKDTLKNSKKTLAKRQKLNAEIREKYPSPYRRKDYQKNKNDISAWNSMIGDLEEDIKMIEMYLDYNDREYLHKECDRVRNLILNKNSYKGEIPMDDLYSVSIPDSTDIVCDVELQEEIVDLLDEVLTERQKQVVQMYFWDGMTQEKIAKELCIAQKNVSINLQNAIEVLRNCVKSSDFLDFYHFRV